MLCLPSDYSDLKIHSLQLPVLILQQTILNPPLREEGHEVARVSLKKRVEDRGNERERFELEMKLRFEKDDIRDHQHYEK